MWPNPQETKDLVTFIAEILNEKLPFLSNEIFRRQVCNFTEKETLAQVFSCQFYRNIYNTSGGCFWKWFKESQSWDWG